MRRRRTSRWMAAQSVGRWEWKWSLETGQIVIKSRVSGMEYGTHHRRRSVHTAQTCHSYVRAVE